MSQIRALIWLNWIIFRHTLRSRKAAPDRIASALVIAAAGALSLLISTSVAVAAYVLVSHAKLVMQQTALCAMLFFACFMWATLPLTTGGGERFDPGRLLMYPISLRKLFAIDLLGALVSLFAIFAAPALVAVSVGVGLAKENLARAVPIGLTALLFGLVATKSVETAMSFVLRKGRTRGETIIALVSVALGLSGALVGQIMPRLESLISLPWYVRWTPPGALAVALTDGLAHRGGLPAYATGIGYTLCITCVLLALTYRAARRLVYQGGGRWNKSKLRRTPRARSLDHYSGWRLPPLSGETTAVVEKELRYATRNAQLRALALMPLILTATFRLLGSDADDRSLFGLKNLFTGTQGAGSIFYVFVILSALACNLFAYEGAGMRTLILAPASRRHTLVGKNIAVTLIACALAALALAFNGLAFGGMTPGALCFSLLCFAFFAPTFAIIGNELSIRFPRRLEFGKRLNASGVAGLLMIPLFAAVLIPPGAAVLVGYFADSAALRYAIIASFAAGAAALYFPAVNRQARALQARELQILEKVTSDE